MDILNYSAMELSEAIQNGRTTAIEAVKAVMERIRQKEDSIHAYITVDEKRALEKAKIVQKRIENGEITGGLAGVPVAVKDNMCIEGMLTTCSSRMLENYLPTFTATAVRNLENAGAIIIGKTNMDEFAMGSTTENSVYGATKNPWNADYVPGGSSGGSAAAVASEECFLALGSDTGGSVRQPASYCGVVGMKPTYGTVSRYGLIAYASSLDQIGPITKNVSDCAAAMEVITSYDEKDSTSIKRNDTDFTKSLINDVKGMRIGIPKDYLNDGLDKEVKKAVLNAAKLLKQQGAIVEEFDLGFVDYMTETYYTIACAEASSNLERFDGIKYGYRTNEYANLHDMYKKSRSEGFGAEVKRRIMLGSFVLSSGYYEDYYLKALKVKAMIKRAFDEAFLNYDVILSPVSPKKVPKMGESLANPIEMYLADVYTISANLAGLPAISLPCAKDSQGLPIGLQLMADCFNENKLIQIAYTLENSIKNKENY